MTMESRGVRFTTNSGSVYTLTEIKEVLIKLGGESLRDATPARTAVLVREGARPLIHIERGTDMAEPEGETVTFDYLPTVGTSFVYWHPTLHGCISTPVASIEEL